MTAKFLVWCTSAFVAGIFTMGSWGGEAVAQESSSDQSELGSGRISVPLSGRGNVELNADLRVFPSTLDMEVVEVGESRSRTLRISHTGSVGSPAIHIGDALLFGQNAAEFSADFSGGQTLGAGAFLDIAVTLTPMTTGDKTAGMRLDISGSTAPYVLLFSGRARYPLTSDLGTSDQSLDFGQVLQYGAGSANFILTNNGEESAPAINVSAIQLSGVNANDFTIDFTPVALQPGEQLDVRLNVDTSVTGFKAAVAEVYHDGGNGALQIALEARVNEPQAVPVNFTSSTLSTSLTFSRPTTLQFGPDDRLYVGEMDGYIHVLDVTRNAKNDYSATLVQSIDLIKNVINHNDDGTRDYGNKRLLTGIHVTGSAQRPTIYAVSSDPRQAAGPSGNDSNLDTNSGILHRLDWDGSEWSKLDLLRGLPRSEENHVSNGLVLVGNKIYLNVGGNTNEGVPSNNFAELPEYALSAAVLEIDLDMIGESTYDLPTLDGPADEYDPFGGHDGLNQAILEENGPVKIFTSGMRNAYDIVYTESGRFYVWDNGPNTGWGGSPGDDCLNVIDNGGNKSPDGLHLISRGYYGGHPNPTRGNKSNTFGGQSPIEGAANPEECIYKIPGADSGALTTNGPSTNGMDEYTASNFGGAMKNDLIAIAFNKNLFRVQLNDSGDLVTSKSTLQSDVGDSPLDVTTQADNQVFPGTIWVADHFGHAILALEPADY